MTLTPRDPLVACDACHLEVEMVKGELPAGWAACRVRREVGWDEKHFCPDCFGRAETIREEEVKP